MPIRYAVALYGAVWLFLTLDARLHGRGTAPPALADACAVSDRAAASAGQAGLAAPSDCTTGRR